MQLDATPFDSDFDDIFKLFDAMRVFAKANPEHEFLPTDDPGADHETPRVPRIGWSAFRPIKPEEAAENVRRSARGETVPDYDEQFKVWTIPVSKVGAALKDETDFRNVFVRECLKSVAGRQKLLDAILSSRKS